MAIPNPEDYDLLINNGTLRKVQLDTALAKLADDDMLLTKFGPQIVRIKTARLREILDLTWDDTDYLDDWEFLLSSSGSVVIYSDAEINYNDFPVVNEFDQALIDDSDYPDANDYTQAVISDSVYAPVPLQKVKLTLIKEYLHTYAPPVVDTTATGGVITYEGDYTVHTFTDLSEQLEISTVATYDNPLIVYAWGAGGGGGGPGGGSERAGYGGGAGFIQVWVESYEAGERFDVLVPPAGGSPGVSNGAGGVGTRGGGDGGAAFSNSGQSTGSGGAGGGHTYISSSSRGEVLYAAGGGGGGGSENFDPILGGDGGVGGGTTGGSGGDGGTGIIATGGEWGGPGTGSEDGGYGSGGNGAEAGHGGRGGGGGGGSGWTGGGGGAAAQAGNQAGAGGGGGCSWYDTSFVTVVAILAGSSFNPGGSFLPEYQLGIGLGGVEATAGGPGLVVIKYLTNEP